MAALFLDDRDLRLLLFGGKDGAGKTTCATATAIRSSRSSPQGSILLVLSDPAHSLADSLAGFTPAHNLEIIEFDARECLVTFKENHNEKLHNISSHGFKRLFPTNIMSWFIAKVRPAVCIDLWSWGRLYTSLHGKSRCLCILKEYEEKVYLQAFKSEE